MSGQAEISELLNLSARLGRDPLLVQASSGNTSIKLEGTLWIKASGKWLAHATEADTLVPVRLDELQVSLSENDGFSTAGAMVGGDYLRASIETAMHAVLPHKVVIHVHSVNTISWAVRRDGEERLAERLGGLAWCWIPYVASGMPLARMIERALAGTPSATIFVLANHGLVVCGADCRDAEERLAEVERRLAVPARCCCDRATMEPMPGWGLPESPEMHALGIDAVSRRILTGGILYPCQVMFLGPRVVSLSEPEGAAGSVPFALVEGRGVVTSRRMTASQRAVLNGLMHVVQRIEPSAPIRYLSETEVVNLLTEDAHGYHACAERNAQQASVSNAR